MEILFCGNYKEGEAVLERLIKEFSVKMVATRIADDQNQALCSLAKKHGLLILDEKDLALDQIKKMVPQGLDLIVINNCKKLLDIILIQYPKYGAINLHSSLLPKYKGRAPINWALINDESETGITIHYINEKVDNGNIIIQERIPIAADDDYSTLLKKNIALEPDLIVKAVRLVGAGYLGIQQPHNDKIWPYLSREMRIVNWSNPSKVIFNLIRALVRPFPGALTSIRGRNIQIFKAMEHANSSDLRGYINGEIINMQADAIEVYATPKTILISDLEDLNGNLMPELMENGTLKKGYKFENIT